MFTILLVLPFVRGDFDAAPATPHDRVEQLELDERDESLDANGPAERIEYVAEFSGTLHVWTKTEGAGAELDLRLSVEAPAMERVFEDDDSGGGKTPYLKLEVEPGSKLQITVAGKEGQSGVLELHLAAAPESEATREVARECGAILDEVKGLRTANRPGEARAILPEVLDLLLAAPGVEASELLTARLWELAAEASPLSSFPLTRDARQRVLRHRLRTLPSDHPELNRTRINLGYAYRMLENYERSLPLEEAALESYGRTLPSDHPNLQAIRRNAAISRKMLGDLAGARALEELALAALSRTLPEDALDLQIVRMNYANTLFAFEDVAGARALFEKVLAVYTRTRSADDIELQRVRHNLANVLQLLGDPQGARSLHERSLEVLSRTHPDDHLELQMARMDLGTTLRDLGELEASRALLEKALEVFTRTLPDDHFRLQASRLNLATTLCALREFEPARELAEKGLASLERTRPAEHHDLLNARNILGGILLQSGDIDAALPQAEAALAIAERSLPDEHGDLLVTRSNLLMARLHALNRTRALGDEAAHESEKRRCVELAENLSRSHARAARLALFDGSSREAEERSVQLATRLHLPLSLAQGYGLFEPIPELDRETFLFEQATRGAALDAAAMTRVTQGSERCGELRAALRRCSEELAGLTRSGSAGDAFQGALEERERLERELLALARELPGGTRSSFEPDLAELAATLGAHGALVSYRRYGRCWLEAAHADGREWREESLCAFVLRKRALDPAQARPSGETAEDFQLVRVEVGPLAPIEAAVHAWRGGLDARLERGLSVDWIAVAEARGRELRRLVLDPLLPALGDASHLVVALDDVLHLVPLDALPLEREAGGRDSTPRLVGERWRIETRSTFTELLLEPPPRSGDDVLVALGAADFDAEPLASAGVAGDGSVARRAEADAPAMLRGGPWSLGFPPLAFTGPEIRGIAALHAQVSAGAGTVHLLEERRASRQALQELAPRARWLHVATHGWFAPESIRSWSDPEPVDRLSRAAFRPSGMEQIKGMSPMLLCGLALAGANLPEDALGRVAGLVTADELAVLDLGHCELVVLSACDTNVGERRAGQGVASLQKALQMAGARSVITSLWKVPDEATQALMLDFYRRLWVEKKPKWQALWEAKMALRLARDERGLPVHTLRDWAAWVLTGEPD